MESSSDTPTYQKARIEPEVFFREFLVMDPKYGAVAPILDRLRREIADLLGKETLSFSDFIDMTAVEYDNTGEIIPKEDELLKALAKAMKRVDVTRQALQLAGTSGLTSEQIAEGPTCIRIPVPVLLSFASFTSLVNGLSEEYRRCPDYPTLIRMVCALKVHQKPVFLLFEGDDRIVAYYSPSWSMQEMRDRILLTDDRIALEIFNAKTPITTLCTMVPEFPTGHLKVLYLGRRAKP